MSKTFVVYDVLKRLCDAPGVSGNESSAAEVALEMLREYAPDAKFDRQGSVTGIVGARAEQGRPTILLDAHIDQIGLIVTHIDGEFVKAEPVGGVDRRCLAGQAVTVHSEQAKIRGVVCTLPPHVLKGKEAEKALRGDGIWIDVGGGVSESGADSPCAITLGDVVTVDSELTPLLGKTVSGAALDDRAGVCAILYALHRLQRINLSRNIAVSFSVQEEVGCRGAGVAAYNLEPEYAIVVDVSYGMSPGGVEHKCGELGGGAMIGYAPSLNRTLFEMLKNTAADRDIPHQIEIMNRDTGGTNADTISTVKGGIKTALISIPLRYMHTPVETADLGDIEAAGKLIAAFIEDAVNAEQVLSPKDGRVMTTTNGEAGANNARYD